jgi:hypothetical protein
MPSLHKIPGSEYYFKAGYESIGANSLFRSHGTYHRSGGNYHGGCNRYYRGGGNGYWQGGYWHGQYYNQGYYNQGYGPFVGFIPIPVPGY